MASSAVSALEFGPQIRREHIFPVRWVFALGRFARRKPLGFFGLSLVTILIVVAIFAPQLAPHPPSQLHLKNRYAPVDLTSDFPLGTDGVGKDTLSRLIYGARISLYVAFGAIIIGEVGALLIGLTSGYFGGWFDKVVQRFVEAWQALPGLIILITLLGIVKKSHFDLLLAMILAIGILGVPGRSRVFRSQVLTLKQAPFVEAAKSLGSSDARIVWSCLVPNVFPLVLVSATGGLGGVILTEASLSFLGFGPAGKPSWGQMLSVEGREAFRQSIALAVAPGVCIALAVFGFNMFGDALRDVIDPRLRGSGRR